MGLGTLFLILILNLVGISLVILFMLVAQPPSSSEEIQMMVERLPGIVFSILRCTTIPTMIYAFLVISLGFRPNLRNGFWRIQLLAVGLAMLFAIASVPIVAVFTGDWDSFLRYLTREPLVLLSYLGIAAIISAVILKRFFRWMETREQGKSSSDKVLEQPS